jgi:hypothetical protein
MHVCVIQHVEGEGTAAFGETLRQRGIEERLIVSRRTSRRLVWIGPRTSRNVVRARALEFKATRSRDRGLEPRDGESLLQRARVQLVSPRRDRYPVLVLRGKRVRRFHFEMESCGHARALELGRSVEEQNEANRVLPPGDTRRPIDPCVPSWVLGPSDHREEASAVEHDAYPTEHVPPGDVDLQMKGERHRGNIVRRGVLGEVLAAKSDAREGVRREWRPIVERCRRKGARGGFRRERARGKRACDRNERHASSRGHVEIHSATLVETRPCVRIVVEHVDGTP